MTILALVKHSFLLYLPLMEPDFESIESFWFEQTGQRMNPIDYQTVDALVDAGISISSIRAGIMRSIAAHRRLHPERRITFAYCLGAIYEQQFQENDPAGHTV